MFSNPFDEKMNICHQLTYLLNHVAVENQQKGK